MTESEKIACKELWPKAALTDESRHASPMDVDGSGFSGRNEKNMSIQIKSSALHGHGWYVHLGGRPFPRHEYSCATVIRRMVL